MKNSLKIIGGILLTFWIIITGVYIVPRLSQYQIIYSLLTVFSAVFISYLGLEDFLKEKK